MIHGDYRDYVHRSGLDSVTQYELWKAIWCSLADRNFSELDRTLGRHREVERNSDTARRRNRTPARRPRARLKRSQ